ncbi:aminoglycoside phosphotransferase family protein [Phragmitibacter flavus]|uniref:Aminoglycoside phosphotransferase family protein n=1 Tax=Phragmitibacter flavus TaxID=2576071 RepID=A0A5R8KBW4_9BACT|nr:aminoglycoside phosphotransferase family protein [Phragmitibacter flavus]TLD69804.1 aminoglycoside phosphotransferase family protein [Phragmitibacter flavus]
MDRRFPVVPFDPQLFAPFFGAEARQLDPTLLTQGACNSNYLVDSPDHGRVVCRIHQRGNPLLERHLTNLVSNTVPVPKYLWVGEGVSVQSYIEGQPFQPTPTLLQEAGKIIGRLAKISLPGSGAIFPDGIVKKFEAWPSFGTGISSLLETPSVLNFLDRPTIIQLHDILATHFEILSGFDRCHNLVHGDFGPNNILISGDNIVGILDWEFAHSGCSYMDIGNLLRHLPENSSAHLAKGLKAEGYDLPPDWRYRSQLMDLASHLEFLTSTLSHSFKMACVNRIQNFINLSQSLQH